MTASQGPVGDAAKFGLGLPAAATSARIIRPVATSRVIFARYRIGLLVTDTIVVWALAIALPIAAHETQVGLPFTITGALLLSIFLVANRTRSAQVAGAGWREFARVVGANLFTFGVLAIVVLLLDEKELRALFLIALPADTVAVSVGRLLWRQWLTRQRVHGLQVARAVVVGESSDAISLAARIAESRQSPYVVVGMVVGDTESGTIEPGERDILVSEGWASIAATVQASSADIVIVTGRQSTDAMFVRDLSWSLEGTSAGLALASGLSDVAMPRIHVQSLDGVPLMHVELPTFSGGKHLLKRSFDIAVAGFALVLLAPALLVIALVVKTDSRGPAIFRQERVGKDGRLFRMLKFRSMVDCAEDQLQELLERNEGASGLFKIRQDPRITRIGTLLRKYSLDELPQFWNILVGDMSIVGPRPPLPREVSNYEAHMNRRLYIKPGLTGLWQVSGRSDLSWERSIRLDLYYVANWSLAGDIHIMWRTVKVVLRPEGAY